jgi:hypothetical protein
VDPFEGLPVHVKAAVDASGGLGSPAGAQVYKALTGKDAPGAAPAAPATPARRTRTMGKKTTAAAPQAPAATPPAANPQVPAAPTQSFATPPAQSAGLGGDLDALLASALATPTGAK